MQPYCDKILCEKTSVPLPEPTMDQLSLARSAFLGKTIGEIRGEYPGIHPATIFKAIRAVRDAIRSGKATEEFRSDFPDLVLKQLAYRKDSRKKRVSMAIQKVKGISRAITRPVADSFHTWIAETKARYAEVAVPLTVEKVLTGVENQDVDMIRLSAQMFGLVPSGGKSTIIGQFMGVPGAGSDKRPREGRGAPFFEERLRLARQRLAAGETTVEVESEQVQDASP